MQPNSVIHEIKNGMHRLIINGKIGRWEPEEYPAKVQIKINDTKQTFYASCNLKDNLPEIFLTISIFGKTKIIDNVKNVKFTKLDDI